MFLRNYYNILATAALGNLKKVSSPTTAFSGIFPDTFGEGGLSLKRRNGTVDKYIMDAYSFALSLVPYNYIGAYSNTNYVNSTSGTAIVFGSGDTAVTFDDYELDEIFSSSVIQASATSDNITISSITYDSTTKTYSANVSILVTNKSANDITVKEFGIGIYYYLIYREVLTTPFTIPAGGTANFAYTIKVPLRPDV